MRKIETKDAPKAVGPYSQAIAAAGVVYASGQLPIDPATGKIKGDDIASQTRQAIRNLEAVLTAAGSSLENALKTTCYLKNIADFQIFNKVYAEFFTGAPARSCVQVAALPKDALVEIDVIAAVKKAE